ncbi:protein S100-A1-like [Gouania willdenowi]|nr:protein S100-A1-like [Gouania willdenowi]XP_028317255.1 protein S100-A1-like [Gouania willdenowi]
MPSDLEKSMEGLILVFHRYASEENGRYTVGRDKLKKLIKSELPGYHQAEKEPAVVEKIIKDLDPDGDGRISFEQFLSLVAGFSLACEKGYTMQLKKSKKK